jgi:hypothetical protein
LRPERLFGGYHARGLYNLYCWNGLSAEQQTRLVVHGVLPFGYKPEGECPNGAECGIETVHDTAPGPRFYCYPCAMEFIASLDNQNEG